MFPADILLAYLLAVLLVVVAPGPDNILALSRGLSQGAAAAWWSSLGAGLGIMVHSVAAAFGLALLIQTTPWAFWVVKLLGAAYLITLGVGALRSRSLIHLSPVAHQPLPRVFVAGVLSNVLNPKPGLFVAAFIPQFCSPERGSLATQMLVYGAIFAMLTTSLFALAGAFAARLAGGLARRPAWVSGLNLAAALTFIGAGLSVLFLDRRR